MGTQYPRIIFNEVELPIGAIFIDFCASSHCFKNIDGDLSKWFWTFTICVGKECCEESYIVIKNAEKLKSMMTRNEDIVKKVIKEKYGLIKAMDIFDWWVQTLNIMIRTANSRKISKWTGFQQ